MRVPAGQVELARAMLADRFPGGWEECPEDGEIELAVYGGDGEQALLGELGRPVHAAAVEADWLERWREFHRPVTVGPLWIGPPWETPPAGALAVVVDPGRAFGTGAHPTTRLCLELLLAEEPGSLVDLGCGSGVLSIAAARLGFGPLTGVDVDPDAVAACRENADRNGVALEAVPLDLRHAEAPRAELATANLERGLVEEVAPRLRARRLIASGHLAAEVLSLPGWRPLARRTMDGRAAELFERA